MPLVTPSLFIHDRPGQVESTVNGTGPTPATEAHPRLGAFRDLQQRLGRSFRDGDDLVDCQEAAGAAPNTLNHDPHTRRRSLLCEMLLKQWQGRLHTRPADQRRRRSEQRPITPALLSTQEANTRRRAVSEPRRPIPQSSRASSTSRTLVNGSRTRTEDVKTGSPPSQRAPLDGTVEEVGPLEDVMPDEKMIPVAGRPQSHIDAVEIQSSALGSEEMDLYQLERELDTKWALNLSIQYKDDTEREKMFFTYAEKPNLCRRVTVSWTYKGMRRKSMEADLKGMARPRDKSLELYRSLRSALPEISFFSTVTNLRLRTRADGRVHIYPSEDLDAIVDYPEIEQAGDMECPRYKESEVALDAHLAGFVYRVHVDGKVMVKKEVPGKDSVAEFMYELDALDALRDHESIIDLQGLVTDEEGKLIKAVLISNATKGSLAQIIYDWRDTPTLTWPRRRKWAGQIIGGLAAIHEAGFVQGDLTLDNIVIDEHDNAKIIDLNRRGCPVGFEPPELLRLIHRGQGTQMLISTKTDLFQLGMLLWGLAENFEDPERMSRARLESFDNLEVPEWYQAIVRLCLSNRPQQRKSAVILHELFQNGMEGEDDDVEEDSDAESEPAGHEHVVTLDDIREHRRMRWHQSPDPSIGPSSVGHEKLPAGGTVSNRMASEVRGRSSTRSREGTPTTTQKDVSSQQDCSPLPDVGQAEIDPVGITNDRSRSLSPRQGEGEWNPSPDHGGGDHPDNRDRLSSSELPSSTDSGKGLFHRSMGITQQGFGMSPDEYSNDCVTGSSASASHVRPPVPSQEYGLDADLDLMAGMDDDSRFRQDVGGDDDGVLSW